MVPISLKTIFARLFDAMDRRDAATAWVVGQGSCAPTAHAAASLQVDIAAGTFVSNSQAFAAFAGGNKTPAAAVVAPHVDLIYLDNAGVLQLAAGAELAVNPVPPALPAGACGLALVFVQPGAVDYAGGLAYIFDIRQFGAITFLPDGTAGAPSLPFGNEKTTGVFRPAAARWGVSISGTQVLDVGATYIAIGTNPAASGVERIPNNTQIASRNAANNADINLIGLNGTNKLLLAGVAPGADGTVLTADAASTGGVKWNVAASGTADDVQWFTGTGTWTKPGGVPKDIEIILFAGGGGGGGGDGRAAGNARTGGSSGGAGAYLRMFLDPSATGATETVTIAAGGTAGTGGTGADGTGGGVGGNTSFGAHATVYGGGAGFQGQAGTTPGGGGGGGTGSAGAAGAGAAGGAGGNPKGGAAGAPGGDGVGGSGGGGGRGGDGGNTEQGGGGGASGSSIAANVNKGGSSIWAGGGGGGGGGLDAANVACGGAQGGKNASFTSGGGGTAGAVAGNGGNGTSRSQTGHAGDGGGGGGGNGAGNGGNGGTGGTPSGGGGAGGGGTNTGGNGGTGGPGQACIVTHF